MTTGNTPDSGDTFGTGTSGGYGTGTTGTGTTGTGTTGSETAGGYGTSTTTGTGTGTAGYGTTDTGAYDTGSSDTGAKDKAKEAASTAADQGKQVAGTAKEEAANVAGTAKEQARNVVGDTVSQVRSQVGDQATTQRDKLSETLRTLGDDLEKMVQGEGTGQGMAADLARELSDRVKSASTRIEGREPGELLDDVRSFARRRPGVFLLSALAAGVVAGRVFRATADGAAAASLAEQGGTSTGHAGTTGYAGTSGYAGTTSTPMEGYATSPPPAAGAGYGTTVSGDPLTDPLDDPDPLFGDRARTDSSTSGVSGQRTQDLP